MSGYGRTSGSITLAAIGQAARQMGLPDPIAIAEELFVADVDALREWFAVAARIRVRLFQGAGRLSDALPLLAAAWSSPAPRMAVIGHREAGLASREIIGAQVDVAGEAAATLRQSQVLAEAELSQAEAAVLAMGWPVGEDLLRWAAAGGQWVPLSVLVGGLTDRLSELRQRNSEALHTLAVALRADPRDPVEELTRRTTPPPTTPPPTTPPTGAAPTTGAPTPGGIDQDNLDRLAADLRSTDVSTLAMALGVRSALEKARAAGGVAQLLVYGSADSGSQGRAAISIGDITTADNVTTLAPGISNAPVNMADGMSGAVALRNQVQRQAPGEAAAVIAWYGDDIPLSAFGGVPVGRFSAIENTVAALNDTHARAGGGQLVDDLEQFRRWAPDTARFIAVGFSMGATTVSAAAARGARVDDIVLLGSPGASVDVDTARDYPKLSPEHTFVTAFEQDPITAGQTDLVAGFLGSIGHLVTQPTPFGPDPAAREFGAQVIDVESNNPDGSVSVQMGGLGGALADVIGSQVANQVADLAVHHQETNYLSGESLQAVAAVVVGQYGEVPIKPGR